MRESIDAFLELAIAIIVIGSILVFTFPIMKGYQDLDYTYTQEKDKGVLQSTYHKRDTTIEMSKADIIYVVDGVSDFDETDIIINDIKIKIDSKDPIKTANAIDRATRGFSSNTLFIIEYDCNENAYVFKPK